MEWKKGKGKANYGVLQKFLRHLSYPHIIHTEYNGTGPSALNQL